MTAFSYKDFLKSYNKHKLEVSSYRLGQHFINLFIVDSSAPYFQELWNADYDTAENMIIKFLTDNCWDWNNLPLLREDLV